MTQANQLHVVRAAIETSARMDGMTRGQAMQHIIGPVFDRLLRPIYDPMFTPAEEARLESIRTVKGANKFADSAALLLSQRCEERQIDQAPDYLFLDTLQQIAQRPLFNLSSFAKVVKEAVRTSVVMPMTLATHIHRVETGTSNIEASLLGGRERPAVPLTPLDLSRVMRRPSFDGMLLRLTKGPNGFLGAKSSNPWLPSCDFFDFWAEGDYKSLRINEAFRLHDGKVVDLSAKYHLAAADQRRKLTRRLGHMAPAKGQNTTDNRDYRANSSGCPVRHEFTDNSTGETQAPLILTAKDFIASALEASALKTARPEDIDRTDAAQSVGER